MSIRKLCASVILLLISFNVSAAPKQFDSMVVFGDSLSDIGNTTHLLKSLRRDEDPAYLVYPFKKYVLDKMDEFADAYSVPQTVLDTGKSIVTDFFDQELAMFLTNIISKVRIVPIVPEEPYYNYRFSNGRVWNEHLANMLDLDISNPNRYDNQAFGGSWSQTYDYQLTVWNMIRHPIGTIKNIIAGKLIPPSLGIVSKTYLLVNKQANPNSAYFIFSGGNDYLNVLQFEDNYNPAIMNDYVNNVLSGVESTTKRLIKAGARHMIIFGVPNVGITPKFVGTFDEPVLTQATRWHNERLEQRVNEWKQDYPGVDFTFIDSAGMMGDAMENPEDYGISDVTHSCIDIKLPKIMYAGFSEAEHPFKGNAVLQYAEIVQYKDKNFRPGEKNYHMCDDPDSYLFWDEIHPTRVIHKILAKKVCNNLKADGYQVKCDS